MLEDFENEIDEPEVEEHTVYRVFGGDSTLEGGFVTKEKPANPIQARGDLGLSQHFVNEDGSTTRNLANEVATLKIKTTPEEEIVDNKNEPTGHQLEFTTVEPPVGQEPAGYQPGGGQEYQLKDPFDEVVEVVDVQPLKHRPTEGWTNYIEHEQTIIENSTTKEPSPVVETVDEPAVVEPAVVETVDEPAVVETVEEPAVVETVDEPTVVETVDEPTTVETVEDDASEEYNGWEY